MSSAESSSVRRLREQVTHLKDKLVALRRRVAQLQAENEKLREQLGAQERLAHSQAGRFRRRPSRKVPPEEKKKPGRKPGHPGFRRPVPAQVDVREEVPLKGCPDCGGPVQDLRRREQYIEELPPVQPVVVQVTTWCGRCPACRKSVESLHPLQTSRGQGAAKVQLGPRALALAASLNKEQGLTMRKTCAVLEQLTGLRLTPGGLAQALQRVAGKLQPRYQQLEEALRRRAAVYADETSWWVGGPGWWLWVFTTPQETLYRVAPSRGSQVVQSVLGEDFPGVLVSDCLSSYDPPPYRKHKCIAHHLRAIQEARDDPATQDPSYLRQWELLFTAVRVLADSRKTLAPEEFAQRRQHVHAWCERLLAEPRTQPGDVAVRERLRKQRPHLLTCLDDPAVEPTNNRAERALRPAVIARKLSCGNKTEAGRVCFETLASLSATCRQQAQSFVDYLTQHLPLAQAG